MWTVSLFGSYPYLAKSKRSSFKEVDSVFFDSKLGIVLKINNTIICVKRKYKNKNKLDFLW